MLLVVLAVLLFWRARVAHRRRVAAETEPPVGELPQSGATILPATVLPATDALAPAAPPLAETADSVVVAPLEAQDEVVAAPASAGIAALVAEAVSASEPVPVPDDATAEIPVVAPTDAETAEIAVVAPEAEDIAVDPVFEELVQAHGGDPVHDVLPEVAPGLAGSSGTPTTDG